MAVELEAGLPLFQATLHPETQMLKSSPKMAHRTTVNDAMNDSTHYYKATVEGWRDDRRRARVRFRQVVDGTPVDADWIEADAVECSSALDPLAKAKDLSLDICCGNDPVSICAVQDVLFAFVDRIPEDHRLRSLMVVITVVLPNDPNERSMVVSDVWPTAFKKLDIIHENKSIQPGDLSRMHMTAFLTDPLRGIRRLGGDKRRGQVEFEFAGHTGAVWKEISTDVRKMICGETEVKDFRVFQRYFEGMRNLAKSMVTALKDTNRLQGKPVQDEIAPMTPESRPPTPATTGGRPQIIDLEAAVPEVIDLTVDEPQASLGLSGFRAITKAMAMARIRGSFIDLKTEHDRLLSMAENILKIASPLPEDGRTQRAIQRLQANSEYVATIFPKETDISHFGYNESDARFAEYKSDPKGYVLPGKEKTRKRKREGNTHKPK